MSVWPLTQMKQSLGQGYSNCQQPEFLVILPDGCQISHSINNRFPVDDIIVTGLSWYSDNCSYNIAPSTLSKAHHNVISWTNFTVITIC